MKPPDYETETYRCGPQYILFFVEGENKDWEEHRDWPGIPRVGDVVVLGPPRDLKWPRRREVLSVEWRDQSSADGLRVMSNRVAVKVTLSAELKEEETVTCS